MNQATNSQENRYRALSPRTKIETGEEYFNALDWAMKQEDVLNIAVSGPYGSGKSSIIESFLERKGIKEKVCRVSLAAFNAKDKSRMSNRWRHSEIADKIVEEELEKGILKQLMYSVPASQIPKSRYQRLQNDSEKANLKLAALIFVVICCLFVFVAPKNLRAMAKLFILSAIPIIWALTKLIAWCKKSGNIKEISVFGRAVIKKGDDYEKSIFNRELDEIIYFFESTGTNIVIFEDLDRFENVGIFVKIRELNHILNSRKGSNPIRFIYAVRDDLFTDYEERTKFFDFIIPVVPCVSASNSREKLREMLNFENNATKSADYDISARFINLIAPYISDMRVIAQICNEFAIYHSILKNKQGLKLSDKNLFAMTTFKNTCPKDFAELVSGSSKSIVLKAFENKQAYIKKKHDGINADCDAEKQKIREAEQEVLVKIRDLKTAMIGSLVNPPAPVIQVGTYPYSRILEEEFDLNNLDRNVSMIVYDTNRNQVNIPNISRYIAENGDYIRRINMAREGVEDYREAAMQNIERYEAQKKELNILPLKEIIEEYGTGWLDEDVTNNQLLLFLLRHGYIDENYADYINYFYPNSITKEDMNFILAVRGHQSEYANDYQLNNVETVCDYLDVSEFRQKEVLNLGLVDYVLGEKTASEQMRLLISQLSNRSEESISFVKQYLEKGKNQKTFIRYLRQKYSTFWKDTIQRFNISKEKQFEYLSLMVEFADIGDVIAQEGDSISEKALSGFLKKHPDALKSLASVPVSRQVELIKELDISFSDLETKDLAEEIKEVIFANRHYELNPKMIRRIFEWKNSDLVRKLSTSNYAAVIELGYEPLLSYIHDNFAEYVSNVILSTEKSSRNGETVVNEMLIRLLPENKELSCSLIDHEEGVWEKIESCYNSDDKEIDEDSKKLIWEHLLTTDKVRCSWHNFAAFYEKFGQTPEWISYFERNIDALLEESSGLGEGDEIVKKLWSAVKSLEAFRKLILKTEPNIENLNLEDLGKEKVEIMIEEKVLKFSSEIWEELEEIAPANKLVCAENCHEEFANGIGELSVSPDEIDYLLKSRAFADDEKLKLIRSLGSKEITPNLAKTIANLEFKVDKSYLEDAWRLLEWSDRIRLLTNQCEQYTGDELAEKFKELPEEYVQLAERSRHKAELANTEENRLLLEALRSHSDKYITKHSVKENDDARLVAWVKERRAL